MESQEAQVAQRHNRFKLIGHVQKGDVMKPPIQFLLIRNQHRNTPFDSTQQNLDWCCVGMPSAQAQNIQKRISVQLKHPGPIKRHIGLRSVPRNMYVHFEVYSFLSAPRLRVPTGNFPVAITNTKQYCETVRQRTYTIQLRHNDAAAEDCGPRRHKQVKQLLKSVKRPVTTTWSNDPVICKTPNDSHQVYTTQMFGDVMILMGQ